MGIGPQDDGNGRGREIRDGEGSNLAFSAGFPDNGRVVRVGRAETIPGARPATVDVATCPERMKRT